MVSQLELCFRLYECPFVLAVQGHAAPKLGPQSNIQWCVYTCPHLTVRCSHHPTAHDLSML